MDERRRYHGSSGASSWCVCGVAVPRSVQMLCDKSPQRINVGGISPTEDQSHKQIAPPPPKALVNLYAASRNWVGRSAVIFICMEGVQSREQWIIQLVISQQLISNCSVSLTQVWQRPAVVPRERWGPLRFSPMLSRRLRVSVGTWYDYT